MNKPSADQSPLERLLDVGVYAPLGFLLTRSKAVPEMVTAGRQQVAFSRSLGRAAIKGLTKAPGLAQGAPGPSGPPKKAVGLEAAEIAGYEALTAKEVIALISSCDPNQAAWVRQEETSRKNRVTVLRALDAKGS